MKQRTPGLLAIALFLVCSQAQAAGYRLHHERTRHDGLSRDYYVYAPVPPAAAVLRPVLLVLHGGGPSNALGMVRRLGFDEIGARRGLLVVYPNGVEGQWNDGRGVAFGRGDAVSSVDDVGFLSQVIDEVLTGYGGDPSRVFVTGASNGGMMTLRLGCEIAYKLTAIAAVIASMPSNIYPGCAPSQGLPTLLMNGTEDPFIPYEGGAVTIGRSEYGEVESTDTTLDFWRQANGLPDTPVVETLPDPVSKDRSHVVRESYLDGTDAPTVVLYRVEGGGHHWPGEKGPELRWLLGSKNRDIRASQEIWDFFEGLDPRNGS